MLIAFYITFVWYTNIYLLGCVQIKKGNNRLRHIFPSFLFQHFPCITMMSSDFFFCLILTSQFAHLRISGGWLPFDYFVYTYSYQTVNLLKINTCTICCKKMIKWKLCVQSVDKTSIINAICVKTIQLLGW